MTLEGMLRIFRPSTVVPPEHPLQPPFSQCSVDFQDDFSAITSNFDTRLGRREVL